MAEEKKEKASATPKQPAKKTYVVLSHLRYDGAEYYENQEVDMYEEQANEIPHVVKLKE